MGEIKLRAWLIDAVVHRLRKSHWRGGTFHVAWTRLQDGRKWREQEYEIVYSGRSTFPYWEYILKAELGTVKHEFQTLLENTERIEGRQGP
jgi:hypothetical protein